MLLVAFIWGGASLFAALATALAVFAMLSARPWPPGRLTSFGGNALIQPIDENTDVNSIPLTTVENALKFEVVVYTESGHISEAETLAGIRIVSYPDGWNAAHRRGLLLHFMAGHSVNSHQLLFLAPHRYELIHYVNIHGPSGPLPTDVNAILVERIHRAYTAADPWRTNSNGDEMMALLLAGGQIDHHIYWLGILVNTAVLVFALMAIVFVWQLNRTFVRWVEGRGRGGPLCPTCLFELRGSFRLMHCPECGQRLDWSRWRLKPKARSNEVLE